MFRFGLTGSTGWLSSGFWNTARGRRVTIISNCWYFFSQMAHPTISREFDSEKEPHLNCRRGDRPTHHTKGCSISNVLFLRRQKAHVNLCTRNGMSFVLLLMISIVLCRVFQIPLPPPSLQPIPFQTKFKSKAHQPNISLSLSPLLQKLFSECVWKASVRRPKWQLKLKTNVEPSMAYTGLQEILLTGLANPIWIEQALQISSVRIFNLSQKLIRTNLNCLNLFDFLVDRFDYNLNF